MSKEDIHVLPGLYRHFKGKYYYVTHITQRCDNYNECDVIYFDVCNPGFGAFSRPLLDFIGDNDKYEVGDSGNRYAVGTSIKDRKDNVTGQIHRFERVMDLNFQISSVSTEQLIEELSKRTDSPLYALDIEGLKSKVVATDYVIGRVYEDTEQCPGGVETLNVFSSRESAISNYDRNYYGKQFSSKNSFKVLRRTFIED